LNGPKILYIGEGKPERFEMIPILDPGEKLDVNKKYEWKFEIAK
jgi:hypothetical protein